MEEWSHQCSEKSEKNEEKKCYYLANGTWRREWQPTPVFLPRESHGWRSLVGYSPWGCKESDTTERLHFTSSANGTEPVSGLTLSLSCPVVSDKSLLPLSLSHINEEKKKGL